MAVAQKQKPDAKLNVEQQKINQAKAEIDRCKRDFIVLSRHCTSHDVYIDRRPMELNYANQNDLDALRKTLEQLRNDSRHLAVATANSTACQRRDSLERLLDTF